MIELQFKLVGRLIPADHGYALYSCVSRIVPQIHRENEIAISPIRGRQIGDRQLHLCNFSRLAFRVHHERLTHLLRLTGRQLDLAGHAVRVGVPEVHPLTPADSVRSRLVTIKLHKARGPITPNRFMEAARKQLDQLGISSHSQLSVGRQRTLEIANRQVIGFEVVLRQLANSDSILLQERGLGGRRHMGCGVFSPFGRTASLPTQLSVFDSLRGASKWRK